MARSSAGLDFGLDPLPNARGDIKLPEVSVVMKRRLMLLGMSETKGHVGGDILMRTRDENSPPEVYTLSDRSNDIGANGHSIPNRNNFPPDAGMATTACADLGPGHVADV